MAKVTVTKPSVPAVPTVAVKVPKAKLPKVPNLKVQKPTGVKGAINSMFS
jgi:hypothetical protein